MEISDIIYTEADLAALPVGTVVKRVDHNLSHVYTREAEGWFNPHHVSGNPATDMQAGDPVWQVWSLPERRLTVVKYKWLFRDNVRRGSQGSGTGIREVEQAIERLGLQDELFPLGHGLPMSNNLDTEALPDGATMMFAEPGVRTWNVHRREGGQWHRLVGQRAWNSNYPGGVLDSLDGVTREVPAWWAENGTEADEAAVMDFMRAAWAFGVKAKNNHGWCSTFDNIMSRIGITATSTRRRSTNGMNLGDWVDPLTCSQLPPGTILMWTHNEYPATRWVYYVRDDTANNAARTRRLFGHRDDDLALGHYSDRMRINHIPTGLPVLSDPETWLNWPVDLTQVWTYLPVGTFLRYATSANARYTMCPNGLMREGYYTPERAAELAGTVNRNSFSNDDWTIGWMPGIPTAPQVEEPF